MNCPICNNQQQEELLGNINCPLFQNKVYNSSKEALAAEKGKVSLTRCLHCNFVFNSSFDAALMHYDEHYQNEQAHSTFFKQHLENVLNLLLTFSIQKHKVVEVGCGKGHFMQLMINKNIDCIGFDPAYEGNEPFVVKEYFTKNSKIKADTIILRHTLEHIYKPLDFLWQIAEANSFKGNIYIEVPTFDWIEKKHAFWDIFFEHCNYFTEETLKSLFHKAKSGNIFGGQYIYLWASLEDLRKPEEILESTKILHDKKSFSDLMRTWKEKIIKMSPLAIWGAGAKGNSFLNYLDPEHKYVDFVVDINPLKQNHFIGGTGHPIYGPEKLNDSSVKNILVMNENYVEEIKNTIDQKYHLENL